MKIFGYITVIIFLFVISCSSNNKEEENLVNEPGNEETVVTETGTEVVEEYPEAGNYENDYNSNTGSGSDQSPKIKTITVETLSNNIKDGFKAVVTAENRDGGSIDYIYQWKHNDRDIVGATEDTLQWADEFKKGDKITIEVIPFDENAQGVWRSEGSFNIPNSPPSITSKPSGVVSNGSLTYSVEAADPDGDELIYSLKDAPEGMSISDTGELTWQYSNDNAGDYNVVIIVSDGDGGETYQEMSIKIEAQS
ncbi:MAG: putative Ig domain-containing protein [Thermodesulfobacteriota bacterium]